MSKTAIQNQSQKLGGNRRRNQNAGQGQDACQKHQFSGIRNLALTTPEFGQDAELPYDGTFPAANQLFAEYNLNTLDKIFNRIVRSQFHDVDLDLTFFSIDSIKKFYYDDEFLEPMPPVDKFVAISTWQSQMLYFAKTEQDHFLTTMISRYSVLPVWSAVSMLDDDEDRIFYAYDDDDDDHSKEKFLSGIPEFMRTPIDDPARKYSLHPEINRCHAFIADAKCDIFEDVIAPLVESYNEYARLTNETEGFCFYLPEGVVPGICIATKHEDDNGICPVLRWYDDECEMVQSSNNGGLCGWAMISHDFSVNERGLFKKRLDAFLQNAALTIKIAREIGL